MPALDKNALEQWDKRPWRKPDIYRWDKKLNYGTAIWYGPEGVKGDVATEVELDGDYIKINEYQDITGYVDELPSEDSPFLVKSVSFDSEDVFDTLSETRIRKPRSISQLFRWSAGLGVAYMAYWGGEESYAGELPQ